ncbi:CDP-alcohol phosphatidyltransferase [Geodermatophilus obscurus]|uniref:CDP-alcohol phosphatidyltransferase n=1 Tax=Geodermatophilus obscurus TaxID=1861 RepID=A0A1I5C9K9_9ACTN|nr:CDP-alcohol phosphatidyltransferase family protein [Geodermatophilus obscurus]SFN83710.1 CDP-alcohol phosphatidyltransferase [Geodermatophilus obscurus]
MLDGTTRRLVAPALEALAARVDRPAVTPDRVTLLGLALGLGSAVAAATALWIPALVLWLLSRVADGLDGVLARRRAAAGEPPSAAGGYLDVTADFLVYGATVAGVAIGWGGSLLPFVAVLVAYYLNGATFLAFSSLAERTGRRLDDGRSLSFLGGLAEGTETVLVHSLWLVLPGHAGTIAWVWAGVVGVSGVQRMVAGYRALR